MKLEEVLCRFEKCEWQAIGDNTVFQKIENEEFYFEPPIVCEESSSNEESNNCKFILFSSPGAVGKTALAKHIAKKYNGYYWNVAQKTINSTSFMGELAHAIGIGQGKSSLQDSFISAMNEARTLIVLDSFDEAELISRWEGVKNFIIEIGNILSDSDAPSVVLTARTDMATRLYKLCKENNFGIRRYSIDYFDENDAKKFIKGYLNYRGRNIELSQEEAINSYLEELKKCVASSYKNGDIKEFIGYAQVLRILSVKIEKLLEDNEDLAVKLSIKTDVANNFVYDVLQDLIEREKSKIETFKDILRKKYNADVCNIINAMYSKEEQLVRLHFFVLFNGNVESIKLDDFGDYSGISEEDKQEYLSLLKVWLPQHVFLKDSKVMPVFSDYLFAESLLKPELSLFRDEYEKCKKLPTRVFMDCYLRLNDDCVNSKDIYFIDSAYLSQLSGKNKLFCEIGYTNENAPDSLYLTYSDLTNIADSHNEISIKINHKTDNPICLNRVENMSINVKGSVELATGLTQEVVVRQSSLECDHLKFMGKEVVFETYDQEDNVIIVHDSVQRDPNCKITFRGEKNLKADLPLGTHPDLKRVMHEFNGHFISFGSKNQNITDDIITFAYGLKKVLEQFKADKYEGDFAKHKDKIISRNTTGVNKRVLDFLLSEGAIYEDKQLYKCSKNIMNKLKISRAAYTFIQEKSCHEQLEFAYQKYQEWWKKFHKCI